jgi:hypothetical protein
LVGIVFTPYLWGGGWGINPSFDKDNKYGNISIEASSLYRWVVNSDSIDYGVYVL